MRSGPVPGGLTGCSRPSPDPRHEAGRDGAAPAGGRRLDDRDQHGEVGFDSGTQRVEARSTASTASPVSRDEGVRADQPEGGWAGGADDSTGGVGDSSGSDDPPGDDDGGDRPDD